MFKSVNFDGPDLVVKLKSDNNVNQLNLIAPDGSTYKQTSVSTGATTARLQILFKSGGSYSPGTYKLVAATGKSSESTSLNLRPDIQITDVKPQVSKDNNESTGRLLVSVKNTGSGPTWIYNIGFKNAPYANAPQVINGVADTQFERPKNPKDEFLDPETERVFLKKRGVLRIGDNDTVTCRSGTTELTVVVQTPHGNVKQRIRAHLSGGYNVQDSAAVQHPCKNVKIELIGGRTTNA